MKIVFFYSILFIVTLSFSSPSMCQFVKSGTENTNSPLLNTNERNDLNFESSTIVKKLFYSSPQRRALVGKDMNANGAWSKLNEDYDSLKTGRWYIEQQRYGADAIVAGIVQGNDATIERGMLALEWGAKQQQPDGSFACLDNFHSASFYVEAVAHSCISLKASKYYPQYKERIEQLKNTISNAVNWMLRPNILERGKKSNAPYTHRRYLVAAAIGETGVLCGNANFISQSYLFINEGISMQDTTGFNPEKKGYDCSYHAVGLIFAHRYFDIVANEKQQAAMLPMFEKAIKWLLSRIDDKGNINGEGNTRTGFGQEMGRDGKPKVIGYGSASNAIIWWGIYKNDVQLQSFADKVFGVGRLLKTTLAPSFVK